ncbi:MAG: hypothetical protein ACOCZ8_02510 [Bacteroidota bacterium]
MTTGFTKCYLCLALLIALPLLSATQIPPLDDYFVQRYAADSLMQAADYAAAAEAYEQCLTHPLHNRQDNYFRTVALIRAGQTEPAKTALREACEAGMRYPVADGHLTDSTLFVFKDTPFWSEIDRAARANHQAYAAQHDPSVYELLMQLRNRLKGAPASYYFMSKDTSKPEIKRKLDSLQTAMVDDLEYVTSALDSLYRIGKPPHLNVVGAKGYQWYRSMLLLLPTDWLNRRLPDLWQAVRKGDLRASDYAPLEDQVALGMNVPQRFATQLVAHPERKEALLYHPVRDAELARKARAVCNLPSIHAQEQRLGRMRGQEIWRSMENRRAFKGN